LFQQTPIDLAPSSGTIAIAPDYDLPVTVDTLSFTQDDPTINHYRVIGLEGDWTSSSTSGDVSLSFTVPTKQTDVLKLAYGASSVVAKTGATVTGVTGLSGTFDGDVITFSTHKVTGSIVLVDSEQKNLLIMSNVALWAKPLYENASTDPFAIQFTGTIEATGKPDVAFLKQSE
jgi:hypothetical protein